MALRWLSIYAVAAAADCTCNMSGAWRYFGRQGEEIYGVEERADKTFNVQRTSDVGSWLSAEGFADDCVVDIAFDGRNKARGTLAEDCNSITWGDKSQWARIEPPAPDLCSRVPGPGVEIQKAQGVVALGNGYTCVEVDLKSPRIATLRGDFAGNGAYGKNVLAAVGIVLEREDADGKVHSSAAAGPATLKVVSNTSLVVKIQIDGILDTQDGSAATDTWSLTLASGARSLVLETSGGIQRAVTAKAVRYSFGFLPTSIYALFDRGVVQMLKADDSKGYYASFDGLGRLYALGGPGGDGDTAGNASVAMSRRHNSSGVVVRNSQDGGDSGYSGIQDVLAGGLPEADLWSSGWGDVKAQAITEVSWKTRYDLAPNNWDFPVQGPFGDLGTSGNIRNEHLQAMLTGIYGSPVGQLCTHDNGVKTGERVAQMATTIARPAYGYQDNYNFFDPDNYISTFALLMSGDPYLQEQVRMVLERNGDFINDKGQLPHHFEGTKPTYQALSGATQTGPNVFWILSCFNYAKTTGNLDWLKGYMPKLRNASAFLFDMIEPGFNLLNSPGSLMIDVFLRSQFTTDTNAMAVGFLRDFADAEDAVGNSTAAAHLRDVAAAVAQAADTMLFSNETADHYVTQLNRDGSARDFVDYDANFIALAHGLASPDRATKIFNRLDSGRCVHGRATFVSERYYGKDDTTHGNVGDSWCSMGRIGWFDALARKRYGDQKTFDGMLLDPLIGDVNRWTWLHERFGCDGKPMANRTSHYFEYPSVTAMMVHYIRYGIQLGFDSVVLAPFGPTEFKYHVGSLHMEYDSKAGTVELAVSAQGSRTITIEGFKADHEFEYGIKAGQAEAPWPQQLCSATASGKAKSDSHGRLTFEIVVGDKAGPCIVRVAPALDAWAVIHV